MMTEFLDALTDFDYAVDRAASLIRAGQLVAFPTETVYGLGASVFQREAIDAIFRAKGRPSDNPLIVHIASLNDIERIAVHIPSLFYQLAEHFFPGPLTIILEKHLLVPENVSAGLQTVAVRMPDHPVALELIRRVGDPLVGPSANRSGYPSPTIAHHVMDDLQGTIAAVLNGGPCRIGIESTVVSIFHQKVVILRSGVIDAEQLEQIVQQPVLYGSSEQTTGIPVSPGTKYRHYAPQARVRLARSREEVLMMIEEKPVFVLANEELGILPGFVHIFPLMADTLYALFRQADREGIKEIIILCDERVMQNQGLMNRIQKAAEG